jgi:hypothetical protein
VNFNNGVRLCPLTNQGSEKHSSNGSLWYIYDCVLEQTSASFCVVIKSYVSHYQPRSYRHSWFCILPRAHGSCPCSCLRGFHGHHHNVIWVFSRRPVLVMAVFLRYEGACSCSKGLVLVQHWDLTCFSLKFIFFTLVLWIKNNLYYTKLSEQDERVESQSKDSIPCWLRAIGPSWVSLSLQFIKICSLFWS